MVHYKSRFHYANCFPIGMDFSQKNQSRISALRKVVCLPKQEEPRWGRRKRWRKRDSDRNGGKTWVEGWTFDRWRAPRCCVKVCSLSVFSYHQFQIIILPAWSLNNKTCLLTNTTKCFSLPSHRTEIRVSESFGIPAVVLFTLESI